MKNNIPKSLSTLHLGVGGPGASPQKLKLISGGVERPECKSGAYAILTDALLMLVAPARGGNGGVGWWGGNGGKIKGGARLGGRGRVLVVGLGCCGVELSWVGLGPGWVGRVWASFTQKPECLTMSSGFSHKKADVLRCLTELCKTRPNPPKPATA